MRRILCVGNRFVSEDSLGSKVYDLLAGRGALPEGVELVDGGIAGLDLLPMFEGAELVVLVDAVDGVESDRDIVHLDRSAAASRASTRCDHAGGLGYLLRVLPAVCDGPVPEVRLVGARAGSSGAAVERVAAAALAEVAAPSAEVVP